MDLGEGDKVPDGVALDVHNSFLATLMGSFLVGPGTDMLLPSGDDKPVAQRGDLMAELSSQWWPIPSLVHGLRRSSSGRGVKLVTSKKRLMRLE
jgi:hypothetical protein